MQYCLGRVMIWKRNVQFAKQSTPLLTLNLSIAVMLALKKLAGQSKKIQLGKSQFLEFRASANLRLQTIFHGRKIRYICAVFRSAFFSSSWQQSQRSWVGLLIRFWMTTRGYCLHFLLQCHLSGSAPLTYSLILAVLQIQYGATNISGLCTFMQTIFFFKPKIKS